MSKISSLTHSIRFPTCLNYTQSFPLAITVEKGAIWIGRRTQKSDSIGSGAYLKPWFAFHHLIFLWVVLFFAMQSAVESSIFVRRKEF